MAGNFNARINRLRAMFARLKSKGRLKRTRKAVESQMGKGERSFTAMGREVDYQQTNLYNTLELNRARLRRKSKQRDDRLRHHDEAKARKNAPTIRRRR